MQNEAISEGTIAGIPAPGRSGSKVAPREMVLRPVDLALDDEMRRGDRWVQWERFPIDHYSSLDRV